MLENAWLCEKKELRFILKCYEENVLTNLIWYICKEGLTVNNQRWLICHKTQPTNQPTLPCQGMSVSICDLTYLHLVYKLHEPWS